MSTKHDQAAHERAALQRKSSSDAAEHTAQSAHPLLRLQRQLGNAHVARLLAQRSGDQSAEAESAPEVGMEGGPISTGLASRIQAKRGSGSPLADSTRTKMESALGASFEDVRVHTDSESAQINRSISAKAFTTGSDIFLGPQASPSDTGLMAHELTHVVQQRSMSGSGPMTVGAADDRYEHEANNASSVISRAAQETE